MPVNRCSMIGLGDIVLPGFFISFLYRFGQRKNTKVYYYTGILGYIVALACCCLVLIIF